MSEILSVQLLGTFDLRLGDRPLSPLGSARVESVLAHLALTRTTPQAREQLAFRLWPDSTEAQARTNLRHVLHSLRRALPDSDRFVDVRTRTVQWKADAPARIDVADFDASLARAERERAAATARDAVIVSLRNAITLYRGDLLEGHYDEWITPYRDALRRRFLTALEQLATLLTERGDYTDAIPYAERLLRVEPLREDAYRLLMRLHDARGDRALGLQVYHTCVETLEREVGTQPSAATRHAHEDLLRGVSRTGTSDVKRVPRESTATGTPPLVGRADEWARVTSLWRCAEAGTPALLLVTGEAGIGKTRLLEELRAWCGRRGAIAAEARSYAAEGALAYGPLVAWLRTPAIAPLVRRIDVHAVSELSRLLPELTSEVAGLPSPPSLGEDEHRHRLFDAAARAFDALGRPLLLVADDIQWCDHETLRFLHFLLRRASNTPLLVAAAARSEEVERHRGLTELVTALRALGSLAEIELQRLSRDSTLDLASRLATGPLDADHSDALYRETDGNPLFVVEVVRAGWRRETHKLAVPPRVQAVIASRLDQLSAPARSITDIAAALGRDFTIDLLAEAADLSVHEVALHLDELWRARIIREHADGVYDFSHDKIRDVAYRTLSPPQRRQYHLRAAQALKHRNARASESVSGLIADHYDRAGAADEAVTWYEAAAEAAQHLYASREAIRLLTRALELIASLPPAPESRARELAVRTAMLAPVISAYGSAAERLDSLHGRIVELARGLGVDLPPQAMRTLAIASLTRDDFAGARRHGEHLRRRGHADGDDSLLVEAEYVLGIAAFWSGNLVAARKHFEEAVARYRGDRRRTHLLRYGLDPQVVCLSRLANTLWFLGDETGARETRDRAVALAEEIGHEYSRRTALVFAALLALDMRETTPFREYVAALETGLVDRNTRPTRFATEAYRAYLQVLDGEPERGLSRIRAGLAELTEGGYAPGQRATTGRLLVAACEAIRDTPARLAAANQLLAMGGAAALYEAYAHLVRAECLADVPATRGEVVPALERAAEVARRQGARVFEARAALALERYRPAAETPALHTAG